MKLRLLRKAKARPRVERRDRRARDLLDPRLGLAGRTFPPRIEGLAFGPDVVVAGRRRHTLYVTSDNDYEDNEPSEILVFALDDEDLPGLKPQRFTR